MDQFSLFDMMTARWANFDSQESQSRIILEPILEETSDDDEETKELWSISQYETSWSSSSDTGSVIKLDSYGQEADCISERDFLCPPKRRRHEWVDVLAESTPKRYDQHKVRLDALLDEPDFQKRRFRLEENNTHDYNSDSESSLSRTSSLIQFESLEKQLQNENQLYSSSPLLFTYDPADGNKYSTTVSSAPYKVSTVTVDVDKTPGHISSNTSVSAVDKTFYSDSAAFKGVTGNFTYYNHHQYPSGECDSLIETGATSNESDDSTKKCSCTVRSEDLGQQKGKSSLENLSEDSGYCEHSIQLRQKTRSSSRQIEEGAVDSEICTVFSTRPFLKRPVSDPTNGGGFVGSTFGKQPPPAVIASDCACGAGILGGSTIDRGVCKCSKNTPGKLLCREDEEISQRTSSAMYVNTSLKISTMDSANSSDDADSKNTNKRRRNTPSLLKTSSHSLPNIFYHSQGDGEDRGVFWLTSDFSSENTPTGRYIVASASSSKRSSVGRDPYTDFLKVTSYPEGLNSYESSDSFDDIDFYSGGDSVCSGSIAQQNLDLNNFRVARKSKGPQFIQPKPVNVTASCNNLTALDYGDQSYGPRIKMSDHFKKKITPSPRSFIENPEITLLDEISYNFDRNLSIMNDQKPDYDPAAVEEMTVGVLCIKPPQPPPRAPKKIITVPSSPPPLPPRNAEKSVSKDSLSFDRDPTNLVTCYAASLERCNFTLADSLSTIDKACEEEKEIPTYKYNFSVSQHSRLILSTPNLSSFEGPPSDKRSSVEISKDEKGPVTGILNMTTSKGSLYKEVSFHPIVAEISWKQQHEESDSQEEEEEEDEVEYDDDHAEDADDDDDDDSEEEEKSFEHLVKISENIHEQPDYNHVISADRSVSVLLPERDSEIMDKADDPTDKSIAGNSIVDNTVSTPVSRNMVVQEETSRRTAAHESSSAAIKSNVMDMTNNSSILQSAKSAPNKSEKKRKGGFFSRLSNLRFSLRKSSKNKNNNNKSEVVVSDGKNGRKNGKKSENVEMETSRDFIYIPLKEPIVRRDERVNKEISGSGGDTTNVDYYQHSPRLNQRSNNIRRLNGASDSSDYYRSMDGTAVVSAKPPLPKQPPRVVGVCAKRHGDSTHAPRASSTPREIDVHRRYMDISSTPEHHHQYHRHQRPGTTTMISENKIGLIETNLDTHETIITGKTRSLMELGTQRLTHPNVLTSEIHHHHTLPADEPKRPHKSMEFLLDKENQRYTLPPENELQKTHETPLSEHQLRVQASLQRLNIPDWYKQYNTSLKPADSRSLGTSTTNYRKRNTEYGKWAGLSSKTTSLSSLGSQRADKSTLLSPSSHSHHGNTGFSRWSTSHLNSTQTSPSISGRSSFSRGTINSNYMSGHSFINPNVGTNIRSSYRQPYLGWRSQEKLAQPRTPAERLASTLLSQQQQQEKQQQKAEPENAEIQTSIKEVTSAIVHYVNDQNSRNSRSRSTSPNLRKCWLESSFVGIGPVDQSPQTPTIDRSFQAQQQQQQNSRLASNSAHVNGVGESNI